VRLALDPAVVRSWRRRRGLLLAGGCLLAVAALWVLALPHDPPCCFADEPSTNFNAWLIAHTGRDEYGVHLPLYFRAFGEYRSPAEIYLLAGLDKVIGAHLLTARYLTRAAVFVAVLIIGWLAWRISGRRWIGVAVAALGLTTPMLYEVSRLGTEGPLITLPIAAFLAGVFHASRRGDWPLWLGPALSVPLGLLAYTYPAGRPGAPLLALGLVLFWRAGRRRSILAGWIALAVLMAPIALFTHRHPGALSGYAGQLTWYDSGQLPFAAAWNFVSHLARNLNPWAVLVEGDPQIRHHIGPLGALLAPMWLLSWAGLAIVALRRRGDAWWRYVVFATFVLLVPATLTRDVLHTPRLVAVPIAGLLLCVPALEALASSSARRASRVALAAGAAVTLAGAGLFIAAYVRDGTGVDRVYAFQGDFGQAFDAALAAAGDAPIWLLDNASIHGYWHGVLDDVPKARLLRWERPNSTYKGAGPAADVVQFVPPPGTVVIAGEVPCQGCRVLFAGPSFSAWVQS
jgi:hypothetical protein